MAWMFTLNVKYSLQKDSKYLTWLILIKPNFFLNLCLSLPLFHYFFKSIVWHNLIFSCKHMSSHHAAIPTPVMISTIMELSYLRSWNDSLYQRAQKEGVCCRYKLHFWPSITRLIWSYLSVNSWLTNSSEIGADLVKIHFFCKF